MDGIREIQSMFTNKATVERGFAACEKIMAMDAEIFKLVKQNKRAAARRMLSGKEYNDAQHQFHYLLAANSARKKVT